MIVNRGAVVHRGRQQLATRPGCGETDHALTQRWNDTAESLRIQSISSGAERLARLLLKLAEGHGQGDEHHTTIELPLSQEELASLVSASRATVTRALRDWRQRRLVETSPRHITIIDHAALARIADLRA